MTTSFALAKTLAPAMQQQRWGRGADGVWFGGDEVWQSADDIVA